MGKRNKDKGTPVEAVENKDAELAAELGLDVTEVAEEEVEQAEMFPEAEQEPTEEAADETDEAADEQEAEEVEAEQTAEPTVTHKPEKVIKEEIVKDDAGVPLFKRMAPKAHAAEAPRKERMKPSYKAPTKQRAHAVSSNPALLTFPTDRFGITKDIKKAMVTTASRIAGDANKKELVEEVLAILVEHMNIKFEQDKAYRAALLEKHKGQ